MDLILQHLTILLLKRKSRKSLITQETFALDKSLLIGRNLFRYFPDHGGAKGHVTKYISNKDVHELQYSDGWIEQIMFDDIVAFFTENLEACRGKGYLCEY